MKLLDLFCGAGGSAKGYSNAGFEVVGIDIKKQKHYPHTFIESDALTYLKEHGKEYDIVHASPPCQLFSVMRKGRWQDREHLNLITPTRELLKQLGLPYIIENVQGARNFLENPILLCGTMFNLGTSEGAQLRRHRLFEVSEGLISKEQCAVLKCSHNKGSSIGVYRGEQHPERKVLRTVGVYGHSGGSSRRDGINFFSVEKRREAMQIDWMTQTELSQAVPPAYTEFLGKIVLKSLQEKERALKNSL